jgi:hypothetical protein
MSCAEKSIFKTGLHIPLPLPLPLPQHDLLKHFIRPNPDPLHWKNYISGEMLTDLKNMFWLEEELAGASPQVEGGGGQLRQLAHIAQVRVPVAIW